MTPRYAMINLAFAAGCASILAACTSHSGGAAGPSGPAATAMPVAAAPSGTYSGRGAAANLAPDADSLKRWSAGSFSRGNGGPGNAADFEMIGTGAPQGSNDLYSPPVTVQAGKSYIFSLWIDPSHIASGSAVLGIYAPSRLIAYGQVRINAGPAGRYSVSGILPKDQSQVRIDFQPNGVAVANGSVLRVSQPMLVPGVLKTPSIVMTPAPKPAKIRVSPSP